MTFDKGSWNSFIDKTEENHRKICDIDIVDLAKKYGTPTFILFEKIIEDNFKEYNASLKNEYPDDYLICYAVKSNPNIYLLNLLSTLGSGADVASEFELQLALDAKIPKEKIRANGNCKSETYLEKCIDKGIIINVDPEDELNIINNISGQLGKNAIINIRLSGFPLKNVTSRAISTFEPNDWKIIKEKIKNTRKVNYTWANELIGYEYNSDIDDIEWIGEELSCEYTPNTFIQNLFNKKYSEEKSFKERLNDIGTPRFVIEPGRSMIGNACVTITKVGHISKTPIGENLVHVDTGVNTYTVFQNNYIE